MKKVFKITLITLASILAIAFIGMVVMDVSPIALGMHDKIQNNDGIAIDGYDVVAYFKQDKAIKGSDEYSYSWNGLEWKFSSAENLEIFTSNSNEYEPCYGGHCAFAVGKGFAAPGNPEFWAIANGKLLFFANDEVKTDALADIEHVLTTGDNTWK